MYLPKTKIEKCVIPGIQEIGTEVEWNKLWEKFTEEKDAAEKNKLMYGLTGIRDESILRK